MVLNLRPKCANPSCAASFEWLAGGKLFRFPRDVREVEWTDHQNAPPMRPHSTGHFWLCEHCANIYTLQYERGRGVVIRPLWPQLPAAENRMHLLAPEPSTASGR